MRSSLIKFVARHSAEVRRTINARRDARYSPRPSCFSMHSDYSIGASRGSVPWAPSSSSLPPSFLPLPAPPPVALIIPCMQSAELCAWEYKKKCGIALQVPPDTLHTAENSALVSNVILSHKAWWCIMCTHTRKSRMQSDAPAKETRLIAIMNNDFGTSAVVWCATIG